MNIKKILTKTTVATMLVGSFATVASAEENVNNVSTQNNTSSQTNFVPFPSTSNDDIGDKGTFKIEGADYNYEFKEDLEKGIREFSFGEGADRQVAIYDMKKGEITLDGRVVADGITSKRIYAPPNQLNDLVIGTDRGGGVYNFQWYDEGAINVNGISAVVLAGILAATVFKKHPGTAAAITTAAGIIAAVSSNYFTLRWNLYHYKSKYKNYYQDSINFYRGATGTNRIYNVTHYYGAI